MSPRVRRALVMLTLVLTGECMYLLVYIVRRDFGNAMVETLEISHTQLGSLASIYGGVALLCYFPGGLLADRVPARWLMIASCVTTALGGFALATFPSYTGLLGIFAAWGLTTILTFWAALIKVARAWGGERYQGRAFGFLDGGRALVSAIAGTLGIWVFSLGGGVSEGLRLVIVLYSASLLVCALLVHMFVGPEYDGAVSHAPLRGFRAVIRSPVTWYQATIIFCAYAGYWGTFNLASYANAGFGLAHRDAAVVSVVGAWCGPLVAISAGFVAERVGTSRAVMVGFAVLGGAFALLAAVEPSPSARLVLWVGALGSSVAAFGLRGLYYSLLDEGRVPVALTGTTVGVVSILGYTPDIVAPPYGGWLVDTLAADGYRVFFATLAVGCVVGGVAAVRLRRLGKYGTPHGFHTHASSETVDSAG